MPSIRSPVIAQATAASSRRPKISPSWTALESWGTRRRVADSMQLVIIPSRGRSQPPASRSLRAVGAPADQEMLDRFARLCEIGSPTGEEREVADAVLDE